MCCDVTHSHLLCVLALFLPLKSPSSAIHSCKAFRPEIPSICSSVGDGLPCIHTPGSDTRLFTACIQIIQLIQIIQIIQTERHCVSQATVLAPLRTRIHPPPKPRLSRRSPMADEAEIASVISLIQGMYINNVSVTLSLIFIFSNWHCNPLPLLPILADNDHLIPLFLARHECARPRG